MKKIAFKPFPKLTGYITGVGTFFLGCALLTLIFFGLSLFMRYQTKLPAFFLVGDLFMLLSIAFYVAFLIGVSIWFYRLTKKLKAMYVEKLRYHPWLAGFCFFIPFMNLYWPYKVLLQSWRVPSAIINNTQDFRKEKKPLVINLWYVVFLTGIVFSMILNGFLNNTFGQVNGFLLFGIVYLESLMVSVGLLFSIILLTNQRFNLAKQKLAQPGLI